MGQCRRFAAKVALLTALVGGLANANDREPERPHTWSQSISQVDTVCLLQWISPSPADGYGYLKIQFEVVEVLKCPANAVKKGDRLILQRAVRGQKQDLFFILGVKRSNGSGIDWEAPFPTTRAGFDFIAHAPAFGGDARKRLPYFMKFLGSTDPFIAPDVLAELGQVSFMEMVALAPLLPRDKLRKAIVDAKSPPHLAAAYGFLLGMCGDAEDAKLLVARVREKSRGDLRSDIELIAGYLMLTGNAGMDELDVWKLKDKSASLFDINAVSRALRFMWAKRPGKIKKERMIQSIRLLLDRPDFAHVGIAELARWGDWSPQDRIVAMYDRGGDKRVSINIAVIDYLLDSMHAKPPGGSTQRAEAAKRYLEQLRAKDPLTVKSVERTHSENEDD